MPRSKATTRPATTSDAMAYLAKATEFLQAAQDSLALENYTAATGNGVHAGIAAADAISAGRSGAVWHGEHDQAPKHLESTSEEGKQAARQLRRLLPLKSRAEYDPTPIRSADARAAVKAAERMVTMAATVVASLHPHQTWLEGQDVT